MGCHLYKFVFCNINILTKIKCIFYLFYNNHKMNLALTKPIFTIIHIKNKKLFLLDFIKNETNL